MGGQASAIPLRVGGVVPFTAIDYPGKLAAVVFCQGCPWRCGYCHNPHLLPARGDDERDFGALVEWLAHRRGLLDAVVFSGGEPAAQAALRDAIAAVRELGFAVGLHTGGAYPRRLAEVLRDVDWIGLDIKAPFAEYETVTGIVGSGRPALASLDLILGAGIAYEVRTTLHPALMSPAMIERLARQLAARGIERWVLQRFRPAGCADQVLIASAASGATLDRELLERLAQLMPDIEVRA